MSEVNNYVPIYHKITLSIKEANKLNESESTALKIICTNQTVHSFLFVVTKKIITRKEFEKYISKTLIF